MTRRSLLVFALLSAVAVGGCAPSSGAAPDGRDYGEVHGTMVDVVFAFEAAVAVWLDTGDETIKLLAERDTAVYVSGLPVTVGALPEYVGSRLTAFCRRQRDWCLDTRLIEIDLDPGTQRGRHGELKESEVQQ